MSKAGERMIEGVEEDVAVARGEQPASITVAGHTYVPKERWQPIETAPHDEWILLFLPWSGKVLQGRYNTRRGRREGWRVCFAVHFDNPIAGQPSHWMAFPSPPE